ncbi:ABC transporter permease [Macrococcoides caseolyticum]|uniref:ABC transporter permease n=1 Tax=Macrococcoides caseolyticum TaxID=69966 RepID=UPI001F1E70D4|nr:ABC transporter permease subunit [Macrococcus caseolyticus]MCE4956623.1 ABC transporter permease subunit [Macrococcus caseolyticus]
MSKFYNLISNELKKIFAKKMIWTIVIAMLISVVGVAMLTESSDIIDTKTTYDKNWKKQLMDQNKQLAKDKKANPAHVQRSIEKNNYYIKHNLKPHHYQAGDFVIDNAFLTALISLITIVIAGGLIANEFTYGTIKQLLIRPVSRTTILASKYVAMILFSLCMMILLLCITYIVGLVFFGATSVNPKLLFERPDKFVSNDLWREVLLIYGLKLVHVITLGTFGFMISSILRNNGLAIGLSMFIMFLGSTVSAFITQYEWSKYLLFTNSDLSRYYHFIGPFRDDMTLSFSVTVTSIYLVVFLICAWYAFVKRDVN